MTIPTETPAPAPADPAPVTYCRVCGVPMATAWQAFDLPGLTGFYLVTCVNRGCRCCGFTFSVRSYATLDLTPYR